MAEGFIPKEVSHLIGQDAKQKGVLGLIKGFLPFFGVSREQEQRSLVGRIHAQLQKDAHAMLIQLQTLKESLQKELDNEDDGQLWSSFEAVINPLLREYRLIERQLIQPTDGEQENDNKIKNVNQWIDRAKLWVSLCSKPTDRCNMIQAVIDHTLHVLDMVIDRDLKTLDDYKEHELQLLGLGEEAYAVVRNRLDRDLAPYIDGLHQLKNQKPVDIELQTLVRWKVHADEERNHLFNAALQMIDNIVNAAIPFAPLEEEQEHLKDLIYRISYLENESQMLLSQLDNRDQGEFMQREMFETSLAFFEEEVHQIHHDLRLTPELIERVQGLIQQLVILRCRFKDLQ